MPDPAPPSLLSRDPRAWLIWFGPGAIIASLTIGAGELIFSTRGGALFGYPLLAIFLAVCVLKWTLLHATARHMILTGAHPFERWAALPGPRGWLPMTFLLLAILAFPVWIAFHAGTLGTLLAHLAGGPSLLWALAILAATLVLAMRGGYQRLEKIQLAIVLAMLLGVTVSLILLRPDWLGMIRGVFQPQALRYPDWAPESLRARPLWVELATYVGVIGGSGYDYLAYVSYLRDKRWGQAGAGLASAEEIADMAAHPRHPNRLWLRAPLIDGLLSFAVVLAFTLVFVACGKEVLGPRRQFPDGGDLLTLQRLLLGDGSAWFSWLYYAGAFLALFGTLYGTIETAPVVLREAWRAIAGHGQPLRHERRWAILWVGGGGLVLLLALFLAERISGQKPSLIKFLTPAALFTSVLACGLITALSLWADRRFLPPQLRAGFFLGTLLVLASAVFLAVGAKAYWDQTGQWAVLVFFGPLALGWLVSAWRNRVP